MTSTEDILKKYGSKIERQMKTYDSGEEKFSKSYETFKSSMMPEFSRYEGWCKSLGKIISMKVGEKDKVKIQKSVDIAHLNVTPEECLGLSVMLLIVTLFGGLLFFFRNLSFNWRLFFGIFIFDVFTLYFLILLF